MLTGVEVLALLSMLQVKMGLRSDKPCFRVNDVSYSHTIFY